MKSYKFLVPVGIAAGALIGNSASAKPTAEPKSTVEQLNDSLTVAESSAFVHKYVANGEEHALTLRLSGQGVFYAQHDSHVSHDSHSSHSSHSSHASQSHASHASHSSHSSHTSGT
jgi:hypothetical protein